VYAITTLLVVVALSLLVTRVATVILAASGLSKQAARFQARSAFTGSGFTTSESEKVVNHPLRRKVIMWLMFLGNAGIVAGAGTLIIGFRHGGTGSQGWRLLLLGVGLLALLYASRNKWVDRKLTTLIGRILRRYTDLPTRDLDGLLELHGTYAVSELAVEEGDWLARATLRELDLRDEGVAVLGVSRPDGRYLGAPVGSTKIWPHDVLVLYGEEQALSEIDRRPKGDEGDARHEQAVAQHSARVEADARRDASAVPDGRFEGTSDGSSSVRRSRGGPASSASAGG
jgi:hypothetical protein